MKNILKEIKELMSGATTRAQETAVAGLHVVSGDVPTHQLSAIYKPMIGFTVQGTKVLSIGDKDHRLKGPCYYILPISLPATATVFPDLDGAKYMSLGLEIQRPILQELLNDVQDEIFSNNIESFGHCEFDEELLMAWLRLFRLTKTPKDIPALSSVYKREIMYRVLSGPHGWQLRQLGYEKSDMSRITRSVDWLRRNFKQPVEVASLAKEVGMSITTFHRRFKLVTGLSPIQFQKQLRLLAARKILAFDGFAVSSAAYEVGYESPSQFNREYYRFFGKTPSKDAAEIRKIESLRH